MNSLKEKEEKRSRKEERENQQQQQRQAAPLSECGILLEHAWQRGILLKDLESAAKTIGMREDEVSGWLQYMEEVGWKLTTGQFVHYNNFRRSLRMWHKIQQRIDERMVRSREDRAEARRKKETASQQKKMEKIAASPHAWELCKERCANFIDGKCRCGVVCPPAWQLPRSRPPEDCEYFIAKNREGAV